MRPPVVQAAGHPRYPWCVLWYEGGKRRKSYHKTRRDATAARSKREAALLHVAPADGPATPDEHKAVIHARTHKVPLWDAVEHWRATVGKARGETLADMCQRRLEEAASEAHSHRHSLSLSNIMPRIVKGIGHLQAHSITTEDLATYIRARGKASSQRYYRAILSGIFNSAIRAGVVSSNPATLVRIGKDAPVPPEIFTLDQAARWLACVAIEAPALLAGTAIGMFAGLRVAEVSRLDWSEVKLERGFIEVTAGKSKTRTRRLVDIMPNLEAWLEPLREKSGPVWPHTPDRAKDRAVAAYGEKLPKNGARHSFVSYHLALFGDVAKTEMQAGHDRVILFGHYRELVTAEEGAEWFTIVPGDSVGSRAAKGRKTKKTHHDAVR
jgi:integrase